jgi:hypothetical protein
MHTRFLVTRHNQRKDTDTIICADANDWQGVRSLFRRLLDTERGPRYYLAAKSPEMPG